jgi:hypothetical protein
VEFADLTLTVVRLAFHENLPDKRGDGLDGIRHGEESHQRQARVRQARMNTFTDGPDFGFAGQSRECLIRIIGHHLIKLAHQSLVGTEHDGADRTRSGCPFRSNLMAPGSLSRKHTPNPSSTVR